MQRGSLSGPLTVPRTVLRKIGFSPDISDGAMPVVRSERGIRSGGDCRVTRRLHYRPRRASRPGLQVVQRQDKEAHGDPDGDALLHAPHAFACKSSYWREELCRGHYLARLSAPVKPEGLARRLVIGLAERIVCQYHRLLSS